MNSLKKIADSYLELKEDKKINLLRYPCFALGGCVIIASVLGGLYVGLWLMFIGGIIQIIEGIKATPTESFDIAIGIVRILFAAFAGWGTGILGVALGSLIIAFGSDKNKF